MELYGVQGSVRNGSDLSQCCRLVLFPFELSSWHCILAPFWQQSFVGLLFRLVLPFLHRLQSLLLSLLPEERDLDRIDSACSQGLEKD